MNNVAEAFNAIHILEVGDFNAQICGLFVQLYINDGDFGETSIFMTVAEARALHEWLGRVLPVSEASAPEISDERLLNTRAWAAARIGELSAAEVIVAACDEAIRARRASAQEPAK